MKMNFLEFAGWFKETCKLIEAYRHELAQRKEEETDTGAAMYKQWAQHKRMQGLPTSGPHVEAPADKEEHSMGASTSSGAELYKQWAQEAQSKGRATRAVKNGL